MTDEVKKKKKKKKKKWWVKNLEAQITARVRSNASSNSRQTNLIDEQIVIRSERSIADEKHLISNLMNSISDDSLWLNLVER
jgi:uncharacterized protein with WD repeat